jgi:Uma2 family endonuclease
MAANLVHQMTVEEFRQLPESVGEYDYELHYGELVPVSRPKLKHHILQARLRDLLRPFVPPGGWLDSEIAFRALPEYDFRVADVAFVSPERWAKADPDDNIHGAPDLVIEILSPSNTAREMYDKEQLCLAKGCLEFWVVDPDKRYVRVARADGPSTIYRAGQQIPLEVLGSRAFLSVDDLFA